MSILGNFQFMSIDTNITKRTCSDFYQRTLEELEECNYSQANHRKSNWLKQIVDFILYKESTSEIIEPDTKSYVFMKMIRNRNQFRYQTDIPINDVPREESQIASSNDILFIPYQAAMSLMERSEDGDLVLI